MLNLMYITNNPEVANIIEDAGIDWIFVDMEFLGKDVRQGGLDTVQNHHSVDDIRVLKQAVKKAKILTRVNPIHEKLPEYMSSEEEINLSIEAGTDIIMLPYFKTVEEVKYFLGTVGGRAKTCLLLETPEALGLLDEILELKGIDMIHIGLNDLHLALGMKFMFELLADGTVDKICEKIKTKGIPFGFGGIASLDKGAIPGEMILKEHYRLGSSMVIVSRSFCNTDVITDMDEVRSVFNTGIAEIRQLEQRLKTAPVAYFAENKNAVINRVRQIIVH